ncbi:IS481 family transposase [Nakamurella antarctica]|uniref:IS481 family transposase n=1 Tax=Nakamurella antarctica TaxID=1902245 RepID=A0A3G8ZU99_9ACTN|nr:IS481 family transposase [Nakamurella antarctica]
MSKRKLVITAVLTGTSQTEVACTYGVSQGWISRLMVRYHAEGDIAFQPLSRRPKSSPNVTLESTLTLIVKLREQLAGQGLDAGPDTIRWHLAQHHDVTVSRATISRHLARAGLITPEPKKRPKSSYIRFAAEQPNECWQSDFTHYRLTQTNGAPGTDVEIITWLDDHSRYVLHLSAHARITGMVVTTTFGETIAAHGIPACTLTDNGMVYTARFAGGKGGRNGFENELRRLNITQKNGKPNHPQTQGKVERFQQTLKKWLRAQTQQPSTVPGLQTLLDTFAKDYNHHRPHRSLPHHATPAAAYALRPKATPTSNRTADTHDRVRDDRVSKAGTVTLRHNGKLHHIGIGRTYAGTYIKLLIQDLNISIADATTGHIIRDLTLDPTRDYQPIPQRQMAEPTDL